MNLLSLFSGVGGFELGAENTGGFNVVGQSEVDPQACQVLAGRWPDVTQLGDIRAVDGRGLGRVDVVSAGFPCQDLSLAGRREGLAGSRSGLWWEVARILDETRATWLCAENVPGLLSADDGRAMGAVVGSLADLGMVGAWRVLDAQHFGVPQRRRRVFIVARRVGASGPHPAEILFERRGCSGSARSSGPPAPNSSTRTRSGAADRSGTVGALTAKQGGPDDNSAQAGHLVGVLATKFRGVEEAAAGQLMPVDLAQVTSAANRARCLPGSVAPTLAASGRPSVAQVPIAFDARQDPSSMRDCSPTLDAQTPTISVLAGAAVRRLMPIECERLMGWPDHHTAPAGADTHRYRLCGNGVVAPIAAWIFQGIKEAA